LRSDPRPALWGQCPLFREAEDIEPHGHDRARSHLRQRTSPVGHSAAAGALGEDLKRREQAARASLRVLAVSALSWSSSMRARESQLTSGPARRSSDGSRSDCSQHSLQVLASPARDGEPYAVPSVVDVTLEVPDSLGVFGLRARG
jgi:hypothetical protein